MEGWDRGGEWHTIVGAVFGVAGDAVVGGREDEGHALQSELHVLVAHILRVGCADIVLVLSPRRREDLGFDELGIRRVVVRRAHLVQRHLLRVHEVHAELQVQVRLEVVLEVGRVVDVDAAAVD